MSRWLVSTEVACLAILSTLSCDAARVGVQLRATDNTSKVTYSANLFESIPPFPATSELYSCSATIAKKCTLRRPTFGVLDGTSSAYLGEYLKPIIHVERQTYAVTEVGQLGRAPGEYRMVEAATVADHNLVIYDLATMRVTRFAASGAVGATWDLTGVPVGDSRLGRNALFTLAIPGVKKLGEFVEAPLVKMYFDGGALDTISTFVVRSYNLLGFDLQRPAPLFSARPSWDVGNEEHVWMTSGDVYRVFRVGIRGDLELQIDVPLTPPAVDRADVTREVERILGRVERPALSRSQKLALEEAGASEFHPLITDVKAAADGGVWVRGVAKPNQIAVRWTYFDDEGDLLGYLFVSATARLVDATRSEMLMVDRDSLDTPFISWWLIENGS